VSSRPVLAASRSSAITTRVKRHATQRPRDRTLRQCALKIVLGHMRRWIKHGFCSSGTLGERWMARLRIKRASESLRAEARDRNTRIHEGPPLAKGGTSAGGVLVTANHCTMCSTHNQDAAPLPPVLEQHSRQHHAPLGHRHHSKQTNKHKNGEGQPQTPKRPQRHAVARVRAGVVLVVGSEFVVAAPGSRTRATYSSIRSRPEPAVSNT
jgi:hypothetical protein